MPAHVLDPLVREELLRLHDALALDVQAAGPVCDLSGRCCRFAEWDHTLFLSEIEAELLLSEAPPPVRPMDEGVTCPWQDQRGHCTARNARPLGCRVYYCDPNYQETAQALSELYLGKLRRLSETHKLSWNYGPLHRHLREAIEAGRWQPFSGAERESTAPAPLTLT